MGANTGAQPEQALERERAAVATEAGSMSAKLAAALAEVQQREQAIADLQKKARPPHRTPASWSLSLSSEAHELGGVVKRQGSGRAGGGAAVRVRHC